MLEKKSTEVNKENISIISELKTILNEQLSFFKHLSNEDSPFIKAMLDGKWVILDGIESAQPELYQRISSLCDIENQNLTMYDNGPQFIYSKKSRKKKYKIHDDFRLFITYNPFECEPSKRLPESFLNKCYTFSLSKLDESIKTTSLVLSGAFINEHLYQDLEESYFNKNKENIKQQNPGVKKEEIITNLLKDDLRILSIKFANVHHYSNELVLNDSEDYAGKKMFSGRSLKFIINSLKYNQGQLLEGIISAIQDVYCYP